MLILSIQLTLYSKRKYFYYSNNNNNITIIYNNYKLFLTFIIFLIKIELIWEDNKIKMNTQCDLEKNIEEHKNYEKIIDQASLELLEISKKYNNSVKIRSYLPRIVFDLIDDWLETFPKIFLQNKINDGYLNYCFGTVNDINDINDDETKIKKCAYELGREYLGIFDINYIYNNVSDDIKTKYKTNNEFITHCMPYFDTINESFNINSIYTRNSINSVKNQLNKI